MNNPPSPAQHGRRHFRLSPLKFSLCMYTRHLSFASTKTENDSRKPRYGSLVCIAHCQVCFLLPLFSSIPSVLPACIHLCYHIIVYSEGSKVTTTAHGRFFFFSLSVFYLALVLFFLSSIILFYSAFSHGRRWYGLKPVGKASNGDKTESVFLSCYC